VLTHEMRRICGRIGEIPDDLESTQEELDTLLAAVNLSERCRDLLHQSDIDQRALTAAAIATTVAELADADLSIGWEFHDDLSPPGDRPPLDLLTPRRPNGPSVAPASGSREALAA
jgi:hypothetical protein